MTVKLGRPTPSVISGHEHGDAGGQAGFLDTLLTCGWLVEEYLLQVGKDKGLVAHTVSHYRVLEELGL